jgi:superfamily I DNA/RNA helicase
MNHEHDIGGQGKTGLKTLLREAGFKPNRNQKRAICHVAGPLHLPAGPGSGKTRVLLCRTVNLIVFHGVSPSEIFPSTFTEKAARQLQEGLRALLGMAANLTGQNYDLSQMYVGTVHSLCQKILQDRRFAIEGVVDIVREGARTTMYDLKTHDAETVSSNLPNYERQLNIYAHIWRTLRGQPLDKTAVIATPFPEAVKKAMENGDESALASALAERNPVIDIPFNDAHAQGAIEDFGKTVDAIEDRQLHPPPLSRLRERVTATETFATRACCNCDARFSCKLWKNLHRQKN